MRISMGVIARLFSTEGRVSRGRFWLVGSIFGGTLLLLGFLGVVVVHVLGVQGTSLNTGLIEFTFRRTGTDFNVSPWLAVLLLPTAVKRLHDRGHSGWRLATFVLAHFVFYLLGEVADGITDGRVSVLPSLSPLGEAVVACLQTTAPMMAGAIAAWCFVELACLSGTVGANRYGADPTLRRKG